MRFVYVILLLLCLTASQAMAADIVYSKDGNVKGRVKTYVDGLLIIKANGIEHLYSRSMPDGYYGDYLEFRPSPFSKKTEETECRILFVDRYNVIYSKSHSNKVEMPRYRVKTMIFNTK